MFTSNRVFACLSLVLVGLFSILLCVGLITRTTTMMTMMIKKDNMITKVV